MSKNNCMFLMSLFFLTSCGELCAGNSIFSRIKDLIITPEHASRFTLYDAILDKHPASIDLKLIQDIRLSDDYYLDMIEESILKREHNGSKADKTISISKIAYGLSELSLPIILYYIAKNYYGIQCPEEYKAAVLAASGFITLLGMHNIYKGIRYKKRMNQKLERDKEVRRFLREITNQI